VRDENLKKLLHRLADTTDEPVSRALGEGIKNQIPVGLTPHKSGADAVNIIINLRVGKLTAAAVIIMTIISSATLLYRGDPTGDGLYQYCLTRVKSYFGWGLESSTMPGESKNDESTQRVRDFVYYGDFIDPQEPGAILTRWKLPHGKYRVIFADFGTKIVTAEELVELQSRMLLRKAE
jgi:hypothetical protein